VTNIKHPSTTLDACGLNTEIAMDLLARLQFIDNCSDSDVRSLAKQEIALLKKIRNVLPLRSQWLNEEFKNKYNPLVTEFNSLKDGVKAVLNDLARGSANVIAGRQAKVTIERAIRSLVENLECL
jgi:hypothetical protein